MRKPLCIAVTIAALAGTLVCQNRAWDPGADRVTVPLWPHPQPLSEPESDATTAKDNLIAGKPLIRLTNVSNPTITLYPPEGKNTGAAVVVFPGGAYRILAIDLEGTEVCEWLNAIGVTCVLLKYRVPNTGPYPKSAAALEDAQRAVGMVRARATDWNIDPHRVGVLGFSAGAHLAAALSTHFDRRLYSPIDAADQQSCRPDFAVIVYPGYLALSEQNFALNQEIRVAKETPPTFIVQTEDDPVHVENSTVYFLALKNAEVPVEMHLYAQGGHGYGLRPSEFPVTKWPQRVESWLQTIQMLAPAKKQ